MERIIEESCVHTATLIKGSVFAIFMFAQSPSQSAQPAAPAPAEDDSDNGYFDDILRMLNNRGN